jgi:hypothetical protein
MVLGDIHGNGPFAVEYIYPLAAQLGVHAIVQVGDFGYWEHEPDGVTFLDDLAEAAERYDIPLYWLRGNHDKVSLALRRYGDNRTADGFLWVRPRINLIPDGHIWTWAGKKMRAFGGAYSIDKPWRLRAEADRYQKAKTKEKHRQAAGRKPKEVPSAVGTLWFPEEELTDEQFADLLATDSSPMDIIFSHDRPAGATVGEGFTIKTDPECRRTPQWLQRALVTHRPSWWFHGHLHVNYRDTVRCGDDDSAATVVGLACDDAAAPRFWRPSDSWCLLTLDFEAPITVQRGADAEDAVYAALEDAQ